MDYGAIATEIAKPEYAGQTDAQIASALMAKTIAGPNHDVPVADVEEYLSLRGLLTGIEAWLAVNPIAGAPTSSQVAAKELLRTIASPHVSVFRMSDPATFVAVEGLLNALAAEELLSAQHVSDLLAMAAATLPFGRDAGDTISADVVARARLG